MVLILAAGQGSRFKASGGTCDKLDAQIQGQRVRDHVEAAVRASGLPYHIVEREALAHNPQAGMGDSIACGVAATPHAQGWLVLPADLPLVQPQTLQAVAKALAEHTVVVPTYHGQRGHPVGFTASCYTELLALQGDEGARAVVAQHGACHLPVDDEGTVLDVDTVQALALATVRFSETRNCCAVSTQSP